MRLSLQLAFITVLGCGDLIPAEGDDAGECSDAADNDQDGTFDCDDSDCSASPDCEGASGDTSEENGDPVVEGPHALAFDGSPDCATVEVPSALEASFTVEAWLRGDPDAFSDMRPIALWNDVFNLSQEDDGQVIFTVGSGGDDAVGASYGFTLMDGVLHHVAGVYDAGDGSTRLFVDGAFVGVGADAAFIGVKPDDRVQFGCAENATEGFYGLLDELRISTVPRYTDDFELANAPFKKDDDTLMLFHLDEGTGESATSETGSFEMLITDAGWIEFDLAATE